MPREQLFIGHTVCPSFAATVEDFAWWTKTAFHVPGYDYLHEGLNYAYTPIDKDGYLQGFYAQAAVDSTAQIIVAHGLTQTTSDHDQLVPLVDAIEQDLGRKPKEASADAGYCSEARFQALADRSIAAYIATGRAKHRPQSPSPPLPGASLRKITSLQGLALAAVFRPAKTVSLARNTASDSRLWRHRICVIVSARLLSEGEKHGD